MVILDIVSDLYIDQWDNNIPNNYPRRARSHFPYQFSGNSSKLLLANFSSFLLLYFVELIILSRFGNSKIASFKNSSSKKLFKTALAKGSSKLYLFLISDNNSDELRYLAETISFLSIIKI